MQLGKIVDDLGVIKAQMADLKHQEDRLKTLLIEGWKPPFTSASEVEGDLFRAAISEVTKDVTSWRTVAQALGASRQLIKAHTTITTYTQVRVAARNGRKAA